MPNIGTSLPPQARCPYCGRFMRRGLCAFMKHSHNCPRKLKYPYDPSSFDQSAIDEIRKQLIIGIKLWLLKSES